MEQAVEAKLRQARVGRLATLDMEGSPHVVPVCYVFDGAVFHTAIDAKPKRVEGKRLARVRHILANPRVALVVDEYDEDWSRLWYVLVRGKAELLGGSDSDERQAARRNLMEKYSNYRDGMLPADALIIRIRPERITWWGEL